MADEASEYLAPEQRARIDIDAQLAACGWIVQDYNHATIAAAQGVAVREVPAAGPTDYVLFVDRQAVGVIEAKKVGTTLTSVEWHTHKYQTNFPDELPARLCAMNMLLHGIESPESDSPIHVDDALLDDPGVRFDVVLSSPPFVR